LTARILRARTISTVTSKEDREMQEARMRFPFLTLAAATLLHAATGPALAQDPLENPQPEPCAGGIATCQSPAQFFINDRENRIRNLELFNERWLINEEKLRSKDDTHDSTYEPCASAYGDCGKKGRIHQQRREKFQRPPPF
jgi:hypothetical protein